MTGTLDENGLSPIRTCAHCGIPYDWRRSTSGSLKMTYCGALCEQADLGFTIETLLAARRAPEGERVRRPIELPEVAAAIELLAAA